MLHDQSKWAFFQVDTALIEHAKRLTVVENPIQAERFE